MTTPMIRRACALAVMLALTGCATERSFFPSAGPSYREVTAQDEARIPVLTVTDSLVRKLQAAEHQVSFAEMFKADEQKTTEYRLGDGDTVEISIWEAPPATLFGSAMLDTRVAAVAPRVQTLPEQMVSAEGYINIPFAGQLLARGRTPHQIEQDIIQRLRNKANQPQVMLRVVRNANANVTVVGQVVQSQRMPLTPRGERLLDALAVAGGANQPVGKVSIQLSRQGVTGVMPFQRVIQEPVQNVRLRPGDVVTALYQANSFTALGATGRNDEIQFETGGISLIQALGRAGGVLDQRADARGVFIFRFEDPLAVEGLLGQGASPTAAGRVPVVYQVDLRDPKTFLLAQNFSVRNRDVVFISTAPANELQKFLSILTSSAYTINTTLNISGN